MDWAHAWPSITASFLASLVEFVEALTIVLAVGTVRGWRPALLGAALGALILTISVLLFGPLINKVDPNYLKIFVGVLLLFFGTRWLRKAILRSAGILKMHDEDAIYEDEVKELGQEPRAKVGIDWIAIITTFKAVVIEGLEVVFIVIAVGSVRGMILPASLGAAAAGVLVIGLGLAIHKPLALVPENTLKFVVGLLLSSFGVFWLGEGLGFPWWHEDLSILVILTAFFATSQIGIALAKPYRRVA